MRIHKRIMQNTEDTNAPKPRPKLVYVPNQKPTQNSSQISGTSLANPCQNSDTSRANNQAKNKGPTPGLKSAGRRDKTRAQDRGNRSSDKSSSSDKKQGYVQIYKAQKKSPMEPLVISTGPLLDGVAVAASPAHARMDAHLCNAVLKASSTKRRQLHN